MDTFGQAITNSLTAAPLDSKSLTAHPYSAARRHNLHRANPKLPRTCRFGDLPLHTESSQDACSPSSGWLISLAFCSTSRRAVLKDHVPIGSSLGLRQLQVPGRGCRNRLPEKLANSWQIHFWTKILRKRKSENSRVFIGDLNGGPGWT